MSGDVLPRELLTEMTTRHPIGERSLPGRPWETTAVYHFGDRPTPCTVAAFATGDQEGTTEYEVVRLAQLI